MIGRTSTRLDLPDRLRSLHEAIELAEDRLDDETIAFARHVYMKAGDRLRHGSEHTVAALLGATGAGKSSLANALAGSDVATTGVRRPTTSSSLALQWGADDATPLLDWLEIPSRHQVAHAAGPLDGLIVVDVPDHDSVQVSNRLEMERIAEHTDLMVWVTDPEKYADAALHHYLRLLSDHGAVTVVVLNKADNLNHEELAACTTDLQRLLKQDGLPDAEVIPVSAATGDNIDRLKSTLAKAVERRDAAVARIEADVAAAASEMLTKTGTGRVGDITKKLETELSRGLVDASGIDVVADAVAEGHRRDAIAATGWPYTRWLKKLRPHPLRALHLGKGSAGRSSLPSPSKAQTARSHAVIRDAADRVTSDLDPPWPGLVRRAAIPHDTQLADRIDHALADVARDQTARSPRWWTVVGTLQFLLAVAALVGAVWLALIAGVAWLQLPDLPYPKVEGFPVPTGLLIGGVGLGWLLALIARQLAGVGAKRRATSTRRRATDSVRSVADELVIQPMRAELDAHDQLIGRLEAANG